MLAWSCFIKVASRMSGRGQSKTHPVFRKEVRTRYEYSHERSNQPKQLFHTCHGRLEKLKAESDADDPSCSVVGSRLQAPGSCQRLSFMHGQHPVFWSNLK